MPDSTKQNRSPAVPLDGNQWNAVVRAMGLSPQQARVAELALCDYGTKEIARDMKIGEATIKTYLERIAARTGARSRMQLAMHVLAVSHQVSARRTVSSKQRTPKKGRRSASQK